MLSEIFSIFSFLSILLIYKTAKKCLRIRSLPGFELNRSMYSESMVFLTYLIESNSIKDRYTLHLLISRYFNASSKLTKILKYIYFKKLPILIIKSENKKNVLLNLTNNYKLSRFPNTLGK